MFSYIRLFQITLFGILERLTVFRPVVYGVGAGVGEVEFSAHCAELESDQDDVFWLDFS